MARTDFAAQQARLILPRRGPVPRPLRIEAANRAYSPCHSEEPSVRRSAATSMLSKGFFGRTKRSLRMTDHNDIVTLSEVVDPFRGEESSLFVGCLSSHRPHREQRDHRARTKILPRKPVRRGRLRLQRGNAFFDFRQFF